MFLIDKYHQLSNNYLLKNKLIDKILNCFNVHDNIYKNIHNIMNEPPEKFINIIEDLERSYDDIDDVVYNNNEFEEDEI